MALSAEPPSLRASPHASQHVALCADQQVVLVKEVASWVTRERAHACHLGARRRRGTPHGDAQRQGTAQRGLASIGASRHIELSLVQPVLAAK